MNKNLYKDGYHTELGEIINRSIIKLAKINYGSIIAALLLSDEQDDAVWCLFYEQGGDYNAFPDGAECDEDQLEEWMPCAVMEAVKEFKRIMPENDDMQWFIDWATTAKETLGIKEDV